MKFEDLEEVERLLRDLRRSWELINRGVRNEWKARVTNPLTGEENELTMSEAEKNKLYKDSEAKLSALRDKLKKIDLEKIE